MSVYGSGVFTREYSFHSGTFLTVETPENACFDKKGETFGARRDNLYIRRTYCYCGASFRGILGFNEVDFRLKFSTSLAM